MPDVFQEQIDAFERNVANWSQYRTDNVAFSTRVEALRPIVYLLAHIARSLHEITEYYGGHD
jgi:hypothetical protein